VSITQQGGLKRLFRKADVDGHVYFYDYELPYDTIWDVKYMQEDEDFWRFHEELSVREAVSEDQVPPDNSDYQTSRTGMEA